MMMLPVPPLPDPPTPGVGSQRPRSVHISLPPQVTVSPSHSAVQVPSEPQCKPLLQSASRPHDLSQAAPYREWHTPSNPSSLSTKTSGTLPQCRTSVHPHTTANSTPTRARGYFVVFMAS